MKLVISGTRIVATALDGFDPKGTGQTVIDAPDGFDPARLDEYRFEDGAIVGPGVWSTLDQRKARMLSDLAAHRYEIEVGGTTIATMPVPTDRDTAAKLIAARILAKEDAAYSIRWKLDTGFVTLNAATLIAIADGVRAHVQACFDREDELTTAINAATTHDALDDIDITTGWPA